MCCFYVCFGSRQCRMLAIVPVDDPAGALCRKRKITPTRLQWAGVLGANRAKKRLRDALQVTEEAISVSCAYQGPEAEEEERGLHSLLRVKYVWSTPFGTVDHWVLAARALHAGGFRCIPWELKLPLFASNFPAAITQRQLVPAIRHKEGVVCRAVATPKHYGGELATTFVLQDGRSMEHFICAKIHGPAFLVHPGGKLDPEGLFQHKIKRNAKRSRSSFSPVRIGRLMHGCALDKLMAIATYLAEVERARHESRDVDFDVADALLEKDPFRWPVAPKTVLALWRTSDGRHHVDEIQFPTTKL